MDKLHAIRCFCASVEERSFAAAARALGMVPSAVSKSVAALERELGFTLMNRSTRRLALTDEGAAYYAHCRELLQALEEAEASGRAGRARVRGVLRIGMHPAFRAPLLQVLAGFLERHADLYVETVVTNRPAALLDQGLDLLVHVGELPDSCLVEHRLGTTHPLVCAAPAYLGRRGRPSHPAELRAHDTVIHARGDEVPDTRWHFARGVERVSVEVQPRIVTRDGVGLVDAALGGCGVARPYDFAARRALDAGALERLLPEWQGEPQPVSIVLPPHARSGPAKVRAFIAHVEPMFGRAPRAARGEAA